MEYVPITAYLFTYILFRMLEGLMAFDELLGKHKQEPVVQYLSVSNNNEEHYVLN
jgi:hypothetical protein